MNDSAPAKRALPDHNNSFQDTRDRSRASDLPPNLRLPHLDFTNTDGPSAKRPRHDPFDATNALRNAHASLPGGSSMYDRAQSQLQSQLAPIATPPCPAPECATRADPHRHPEVDRSPTSLRDTTESTASDILSVEKDPTTEQCACFYSKLHDTTFTELYRVHTL
jgi:hypothetical protein